MEKYKKIIYKEDKINIFLELFLEGNANKVFDLFNDIGISCDNVFLYNLEYDVFLGDLYYKFKCDTIGKRIEFEGNLLSDDNNPKIIKIIDKEDIIYYSYNKNEIKKVDIKKNEVKIMENNNQIIIYEKRKIKKYIKKFFFNDDEFEKRLNDILKKLGVETPISIYVHSLNKDEDFYLGINTFSFVCNCNEEKNSKLKFKYTSVNNRIIEEISLENKEVSKFYYYDCLAETLIEKDKPKVRMKHLDLFKRI